MAKLPCAGYSLDASKTQTSLLDRDRKNVIIDTVAMKRETRNLQLCFMEMEGNTWIEENKGAHPPCQKGERWWSCETRKESSDSLLSLTYPWNNGNLTVVYFVYVWWCISLPLIVSRSNGKCLTYNSLFVGQESSVLKSVTSTSPKLVSWKPDYSFVCQKGFRPLYSAL